jgi:hypothetical protein
MSFMGRDNTGYNYNIGGSFTGTKPTVATVGSAGLVTGISYGALSVNVSTTTTSYNSNYCAVDPSCPAGNNFVSGSSPGVVAPTVTLL